MTLLELLIAIIIFPFVKSIWPPSYKINLTHEDTFVISEVIGIDDTEDIYEAENEMIQKKQLKRFNLNEDNGKYSQLHQLSSRHNNKASENNGVYKNKLTHKLPEVLYEDDALPWEGGIVDNIEVFNNSKYNKREDEVNKTTITNSTVNDNTNVDYDYKFLKIEYDDNLQNISHGKQFLNYTETKDEETVETAFEVILAGEQISKNCTAADRKGIGFKAVKCIWYDLTKNTLSANERKTIFHHIGYIIFIWIFIYLLVAIPCWCSRGWCCCCCQCKFCKPRERIDAAKKFLVDNPVGVYHTPDYVKVTYKPTDYEKYTQARLELAILKL